MNAITILQPYAQLIAIGAKRYETRSWRAPEKCTGQRIAIHAGKSMYEFVGGYCGDIFLNALADALGMHRMYDTEAERDFLQRLSQREFTFGAVIATATLAECWECHAWNRDVVFQVPHKPATSRVVRGSNLLRVGASNRDPSKSVDSRTPEFLLGDFSSGRYAWELTDVEPLPEPIPARGYQGIWQWTPPNEDIAL
jgi:hypothetical protein